MILTFVDVQEPVLNVYQLEAENPPPVGEIYDFGLPRGNRMYGTWIVLSVERLAHYNVQADTLRVNIVRINILR